MPERTARFAFIEWFNSSQRNSLAYNYRSPSPYEQRYITEENRPASSCSASNQRSTKPGHLQLSDRFLTHCKLNNWNVDTSS